MSKRKGFTLIELIMVIVIIGILAAIAIPRFIDLRNDARRAASDGNVGALRAALSNYYARRSIAEDPTPWPTGLHEASFVNDYLQGGTFPSCPFGGSYDSYLIYNATTGELTTTNYP
ncbi:MAG: type II secretion system protein [Candidatus Omnitrophota bacterium]|nr:MAG: type II secretion system protein [Candidatus Omnitrophota bacterium]